MGSATFNRHRPAIAAAKRAVIESHNFGHGPMPPSHETLRDRAARLQAAVIARRGELEKLEGEETRAVLALGEGDEFAVERVRSVRAELVDARLRVQAADAAATKIATKLAEPETRARIDRLDALRVSTSAEGFRARVRETLIGRVKKAFDEAVAISREAEEILREVQGENIELQALARELEMTVEQPWLDLDQARVAIGNALHAHADAQGLSTNDHGAAEWLKPCRR